MFEIALSSMDAMSNLKRMSKNEKSILSKTDIKGDIIKILCMIIHASNIFFVREQDREMAERNKYNEFAHK